MYFSERKEVDLSLNDWLDGIQKTVQASVREAKDEESEGEYSTALERLSTLGTCID